MSKNKDELLSKLNELIEKHGFVVDKETLDKSIKEYDVSSITDEELIKKCETVALSIYGAGKKGSGLIYELVGRYKNVILTEKAKEYLTDTKSNTNGQTNDNHSSSSTEKTSDDEHDGNNEEVVIKTPKGDISVKIIRLDNSDRSILIDTVWGVYNK